MSAASGRKNQAQRPRTKLFCEQTRYLGQSGRAGSVGILLGCPAQILRQHFNNWQLSRHGAPKISVKKRLRLRGILKRGWRATWSKWCEPQIREKKRNSRFKSAVPL
ncbi:hypothetical protein [Bradyrhizobium sp. USDA 4473]